MKTSKTKQNHSKLKTKLVHEIYGGEPYEYYPLGKYVVSAPGVCNGRPTFKHTRLEVSVILSLIARGETVPQVIAEYSHSRLSSAAVVEAIRLADRNAHPLAFPC